MFLVPANEASNVTGSVANMSYEDNVASDEPATSNVHLGATIGGLEGVEGRFAPLKSPLATSLETVAGSGLGRTATEHSGSP